MPKKTLPMPIRGVANRTAYFDQPAEFTSPRAMSNVWLKDATEGRTRIASRSGLAKVFDGALGAGPIQAMLSVNRASVSTQLQPGTCADIQGSSLVGSGVLGNAWILDSVPSMERMLYFNVTGDGGPVANAVNAMAFTKDGTGLIISTNYIGSDGYTRARIERVRVSDGVVLWTATISQAATHRFVTTLCCSRELVLICTNEYVRALLLTTGATVSGDWALQGWSSQAVQAGTHVNSAGVEHAFICFKGALVAGTRTGGLIEAGIYAQHFRAGVIKAKVLPVFSIGAGVWYNPIPFGVQLDPADPMFETRHDYYRFSERSRTSPHGCEPTALTVDSAGGVYVARTNAGWGPTSSYRPSRLLPDPDGSTGRPATTVVKVKEIGEYYESNAAKADEGNPTVGDYAFTDCLTPTWWACVVDFAGRLYIGGRTNQLGYSVYALDPFGAGLWAANLTGPYPGTTQIARGAMAIDPADNNILCAGFRNNGWDDSGTKQAHLWKLSRNDGSVIWAYDLLKNVAGLCVAAGGGKIAYGTDYAS